MSDRPIIKVNDVERMVYSPSNCPLLYVLRNEFEVAGPKLGCANGDCGARAVLEDGRELRSCVGWRHRPRTRARRNALRGDSYFASVAEISVDLDSGSVTVNKYWIAADVGVVVNPNLLKLSIEGGSVMGISQTLHEEVQFDRGAITNVDFQTHPILTMIETPDIEVEITTNPGLGKVGQGSEPPNMPPAVAIAGAFLDPTGKSFRRLPMRPEYVLAELRGD